MGAFFATASGVPVPLTVLLALGGVALVNFGLEQVIPFRADRRPLGTQTDLVHLVLSGLAPHMIVAGLISLVATVSLGLATAVGRLGVWHRMGLDSLPAIAGWPWRWFCSTSTCRHHRVMHEVPALADSRGAPRAET